MVDNNPQQIHSIASTFIFEILKRQKVLNVYQGPVRTVAKYLSESSSLYSGNIGVPFTSSGPNSQIEKPTPDHIQNSITKNFNLYIGKYMDRPTMTMAFI